MTLSWDAVHLQVDALCPRRDGQRPHETRVVAQLLTLLDGAASSKSHSSGPTGERCAVERWPQPGWEHDCFTSSKQQKAQLAVHAGVNSWEW